MHHTIKITCSSNGDIGCKPPRPRLKKVDTVEFICDDGNYALNFGWHTPFKKGRYQNPKKVPIKPAFHPNVHHGKYKYFVAVAVGEKVWTDDPDVIIEP